jgi:hypothetical protein
MPTDRDLDRLVNGPDMPAALRLWLKPVDDLLPTLEETRDKPLGQLTVPEVLAWVTVIAYFTSSIALAGALAGNVARVAIRGR